MKTQVLTLTLLTIILTTTESCRKVWPGCVKGKGEIVTETRTVSTFETIQIDIDATVYLIQDSEAKNPELEIAAQSNVLDRLETKLKGSTLVVDFDKKCINSNKEVIIYIRFKDLEQINVNGSAEVYSNHTIEASHFSTNINGAGNIDLEIKATSMNTNITGSGEFILKGSVTDHDIDISGSGDIKAYNMYSKNSDIRISGSGKAEVSVSENLDVTISGSGDVYYKGQPQINSNITGSGNIHNAD